MVVFALILLFFANHQSPAVLFDTSYTAGLARRQLLRRSSWSACSWPCSWSTASTRPGRSARRPLDAGRQAPRGVLSAIWLSGIVGGDLPAGGHPVVQGHRRRDRRGPGVRVPDRDDDQGQPDVRPRRDHPRRALPGRHPRRVYVCTLAIQGATTRLMFSMGRDGGCRSAALWGHVNQTFRTPANAAVAVGVLAAIPFFVTGPRGAIYIAIAATGMIYISYFLCNLGVLAARRRGWPHKGAWFSLGSWGTIINVLALIWGGSWSSTSRCGPTRACSATTATTCATRGRTHSSTRSSSCGRRGPRGLPAWPVFETLVGLGRGRRGHLLPRRPARTRGRPGRGRRRDRRGDDRLSRVSTRATAAR